MVKSLFLNFQLGEIYGKNTKIARDSHSVAFNFVVWGKYKTKNLDTLPCLFKIFSNISLKLRKQRVRM
jgi:hypothetical protein